MSSANLTAERARELLDYDPATGILRWRVSRRGYRGIKAGDVAGRIHSAGYRHLGIDGRKYFTHRVIFLMQAGRWPDQIDHINGVRDDNRWSNLREVNNQVNHCNTKRYSTNTSGHMGVCWDKAEGKWKAQIYLNGHTTNIGRFDDLAEAISARKDAEVEYGFHRNHGRAA